MAFYTQAFAHAQDRLWQMQKIRLMGQGRLSEFFGERAIDVDKWSIAVGFHRIAKVIWNDKTQLTKEQRGYLTAYADGVNDFLKGLGNFDSSKRTAFILPPEFLALGIKEIEPWHPIDILAQSKIQNFHMTHDWPAQLLFDVFSTLEDGALKDFAEEILPFGSKYTRNITTIVSAEEMEQEGLSNP